MEFLSLEPFVPSGSDFNRSRELFLELGFVIHDNPSFAENLMINVRVKNVTEFWEMVNARQLPEKFGIRVTPPARQPYGKEVNLIDMAGVCWHFVE
ncbi:MAG TPA: hypothetical protein VGC22_13415 [Chitinophaga sp.]